MIYEYAYEYSLYCIVYFNVLYSYEYSLYCIVYYIILYSILHYIVFWRLDLLLAAMVGVGLRENCLLVKKDPSMRNLCFHMRARVRARTANDPMYNVKSAGVCKTLREDCCCCCRCKM